MAKHFLPQHQIRAMFAKALAAMYAGEVPLYQKMVDIVTAGNRAVMIKNPGLADELGDLTRVTEERHGAIRLGTEREMRDMARLFKVMGMYPVDYYDLTASGLPIHSTAFRPIKKAELAKNPFRVFTSLLRLDIIREKSPDIAKIAEDLLTKRKIFNTKTLGLITKNEKADGLNEEDAKEFVKEALETFRWQKTAATSKEIYEKMLNTDALLADIACFNNPHINHLTPRTLDIDWAYEEMRKEGISLIPAIQGPPNLPAPPLLRQTSFQAYQEPTEFPGSEEKAQGFHRARFGEIEARGIALTPKGRAIYDKMLAAVEAKVKQKDPNYKEVLEEEFKNFPKSYDELRENALAYFEYHPTEKGLNLFAGPLPEDLNSLVKQGYLKAMPITYEDFLPVSAAGIFRANLVDGRIAEVEKTKISGRKMLESAVGGKIYDPFALYENQQQASIVEAMEKLKNR